jgi:hypothetical protein
MALKWLLDVSSGFDDIGKWCADQVNDGDWGASGFFETSGCG